MNRAEACEYPPLTTNTTYSKFAEDSGWREVRGRQAMLMEDRKGAGRRGKRRDGRCVM